MVRRRSGRSVERLQILPERIDLRRVRENAGQARQVTFGEQLAPGFNGALGALQSFLNPPRPPDPFLQLLVRHGVDVQVGQLLAPGVEVEDEDLPNVVFAV
jgi:hypothetical protein